MKISELMKKDVFTVESSNTFAHVATVLRRQGISSVVVLEGGQLAGIVTERDVVALVAEGGDASSATVGTRMTREVGTIEPDADVADAAALMAARGIRHLPVVRGGALVGMVSIRDIANWATREITDGHELADIERSHRALAAAAEVSRKDR